MKSGFVGLIGRPNVGKSTLINNIIGTKIAIISNKPQTTRNIIQGIYNDEESQIVFVDTPGIHKPNHKLGQYLNKQAYYSIDDVDVIMMLTDVSEPLGAGDKYVIEKEVNKPVILILNKIDKIPREKILTKIVEYKDLYNFSEIIPISALTSINVDDVIKTCKKYLPESVKFFDDDTITNKSNKFLISEMIREKIFLLTEEEVPHSTSCYIEKIEKSKNSLNIIATIVVDRDSLKRIIIGKQGAMIKKIGTMARYDIEQLLKKKVYLDLHVRTIEKWRDKEKYLSEFGYNEFE